MCVCLSVFTLPRHRHDIDWRLQALHLLRRARELGIEPNTVMFNTAISALGKAGCWEEAERLFAMIPAPDTVSFETMIAAYGLAGKTEKAERFFTAMLEAGHLPRDYAFCGLIAAYRYCIFFFSAVPVLSSHMHL